MFAGSRTQQSTMGAKCEIGFSIVGMLVGISVFFCFGIVFSNWDCAAWGLLSGVLAAITLYLHMCFLQDRCKSTATQLSRLMLTGCIFQLAGVCGFVAYLVLAISEHQGLVIRGRGYYLACVWCFMTWKWAFLQFYFARRYKRCFEKETGLSSDVPYVKI